MLVLGFTIVALSLLVLELCAHESTPNNFKFLQNDYNIKFEWAEVAHYDEGYFQQFNFSVFKFNRSSTACNFTYNAKVDLGRHLEAVIQVYRFASNEYRMFPLRFQMNACRAVDNNIGGLGEAYKCGNFTGCPIMKNVKTHICNFKPDAVHFPPNVPDGKYKVDTRAMYRDEEVAIVYLYVEVYRPFKG